jgi:hypothetical protein
MKIRHRFILIIESLHDFRICLSTPICWHESRKGADSCRGRTRILLMCQAPAFRNLCCRCIVLVIAQVFRDQEMYCNLLTIFQRAASAATNNLRLCAFTERTSRAGIRAGRAVIRASVETWVGTSIRAVRLARRTVILLWR